MSMEQRRSVGLPSHHQVQGGLLIILGCALIVALSRDVAPDVRDAGQVGTIMAFTALVLLHVGARAVRQAVS